MLKKYFEPPYLPESHWMVRVFLYGPGLLIGLLMLFFAFLVLEPQKGFMLRVFYISSMLLGLLFLLLHYIYTFYLGLEIRVLPLVLAEAYGDYKVLSLDWGQIVALLMLANTYLYVKYRGKESISEDSPGSQRIVEDAGEGKEEGEEQT